MLLTVGGWFGGGGVVRALRRPAQNWKMKPFGSSENWNPSGKPCDVTGRDVPGTTTKPRPRTFTLVTCWIGMVASTGLKWS